MGSFCGWDVRALAEDTAGTKAQESGRVWGSGNCIRESQSGLCLQKYMSEADA